VSARPLLQNLITCLLSSTSYDPLIGTKFEALNTALTFIGVASPEITASSTKADGERFTCTSVSWLRAEVKSTVFSSDQAQKGHPACSDGATKV
jgi:hypothetical protein